MTRTDGRYFSGYSGFGKRKGQYGIGEGPRESDDKDESGGEETFRRKTHDGLSVGGEPKHNDDTYRRRSDTD